MRYVQTAAVAGSVFLMCALPSVRTTAQMTPQRRADVVLRLLPSSARAGATIVLRGAGGDRQYRQGDGRFLCVSDVSSPTRISMVCHHHVLEERIRFERSLSRETGLRGAAFRERLCREVAAREREVPDGAMEITASLTRDSSGTYANQMTVYHLVWLPHATEKTVGVVDEDPGDGRPWLHHAGTCGAHVMWSDVVQVPVTRP